MNVGRNVIKNYPAFRKYTMYLLLVLVGILQFFYHPLSQAIQIIAMVLLGLFVLEILFEIVEKPTVLERPQRFDDFYQALPKMRELLEKSMKEESPLSIRWLDTSLEHGLTFINNVLKPILHNRRRDALRIELTMLDPSWSEVEKVNSTWASLGKSNYESLKVFREIYKDEIKNHEWVVDIALYRYVPGFHGLLINSRYLFMSHCTWENGLLSDNNAYELYQIDDRFGGREKIEQFKTWFLRSQNEDEKAPNSKSSSNPGVTFYITHEGKKE